MLPVVVPPGDVLAVDADAPVVLYLLASCLNESTCLAGAARYAPLRWQNPTADPVTATVVVDSRASLPPLGPFDVHLDVVTPIDAFPATCADLGTPLTTGVHIVHATLSGGALDLALPGPSCTFAPSAGPDGRLAVRLEPGERIDVDLVHPGDGVLALLTDCDDATSATTCADRPGTGETLTYTNASPAPEDLVLLVDTWLAPGQPSSPVDVRVDVRIR
ncbi:MAG: hypothetical protein H6734_04835 [Alphaproteobacteria bacterium]|nr:hypothetical protein [Alphaproteobacteria bacterium]